LTAEICNLRPTVIFPTAERHRPVGRHQIILLGDKVYSGVYNWSGGPEWSRTDLESNPRPVDCKSDVQSVELYVTLGRLGRNAL